MKKHLLFFLDFVKYFIKLTYSVVFDSPFCLVSYFVFLILTVGSGLKYLYCFLNFLYLISQHGSEVHLHWILWLSGLYLWCGK